MSKTTFVLVVEVFIDADTLEGAIEQFDKGGFEYEIMDTDIQEDEEE